MADSTPQNGVTRWQAAAQQSTGLLRASLVLQLIATLLVVIGPAVAWYTYAGSSCTWNGSSFDCVDFELSFTSLTVTVAAGGTWGSWTGTMVHIGVVGGAICYIGAVFSFIATIITLVAQLRVSRLATLGAMPSAPAARGCCCGCYASIPATQGLGWTAFCLLVLGAILVGIITGGLILFTKVGAGAPITAIGIILLFVAHVLTAVAGCQLRDVPGVGADSSSCCGCGVAPMLPLDGTAAHAGTGVAKQV